jgi:hypothetical protein
MLLFRVLICMMSDVMLDVVMLGIIVLIVVKLNVDMLTEN